MTMRKKEKLKDIIYKAIETTTGHTLPNILSSEYIALKAILFIAWLIGVGLTIYLIISGINGYFEFGIITTSRIVKESQMVFPKITVCNMDPFTTNESVTFLADVIRKNYPSENATIEYKNKTDLEIVNFFILNVDNFESVALFEAQRNDSRQFLGHDSKVLIQSCSWTDDNCRLDIKHTWDFLYGNCYTLNFNKSAPLESTVSGIYFIKLLLILRASQN